MQIIVVAITIGLNGLDGFDVLAISFASPGIAAEWGINPQRSASCCRWSSSAWPLARSRSGRRRQDRPPADDARMSHVMAIGMFMATTVDGYVDLSSWRIVTGLGIGGLLTAINAISAEFANARRRHLCVAHSIGYPVGAVLGGLVRRGSCRADWRSVFYFGARVTAAFIPLVWSCTGVGALAHAQAAGRRAGKINRTLTRMGHAVISVLPTISEEVRRRSVADLFAPGTHRHDADGRDRLFLPRHHVLLHPEVGAEDRGELGFAHHRPPGCSCGRTWGAPRAARCSGCSR